MSYVVSELKECMKLQVEMSDTSSTTGITITQPIGAVGRNIGYQIYVCWCVHTTSVVCIIKILNFHEHMYFKCLCSCLFIMI